MPFSAMFFATRFAAAADSAIIAADADIATPLAAAAGYATPRAATDRSLPPLILLRRR
jgi:hypothetical protein